MNTPTCPLIILCALTFPFSVRADVHLASLFQDHAVIQRDQALPVWGTGDPGEAVRVEFRGQAASTTTGSDGKWLVRLKPMSGSAEPAVLRVTGKNRLTVADLLTGDVWLASGQSNMEFRVEQGDNAKAEIAAAQHPQIRQFDVPNLVATSPRTDTAGHWEVCSPATVAKFSAVAYYFARDWQQATGMPVGIINSTWGGTPVESWMSARTLDSNPAFQPTLARWQKTLAEYPEKKVEYDTALSQWEKEDAAARGAGVKTQAAFRKAHPKPRAPRGPGHHWTPAGLYNGMIAPLAPYALDGAIWYQAESNADHPAEYTALFEAMIRQWRQEWGRELPFYFVQIANFAGTAIDRAPGEWAWLRDAQTRALALPGTGMAVTIDIGTPGNIHPKNKQDVGRRLALIGRHELLGEKIEFSGPAMVSVTREGAKLRVNFSHATGLTAGGESPLAFEIAGADHKFYPAQAEIEGESVLVSTPGIPEPVAVRYAWTNAPEAHLKNAAGLPASPFRSDDWAD